MTNLSDLFGTGGSGSSTPTHSEAFTAASSWTVDHNLDTYDIIVQCWSSHTADAELLIPDSITSTTTNRTIIDWGDKNVSGQVRISKSS
jgi:hypothetical protein